MPHVRLRLSQNLFDKRARCPDGSSSVRSHVREPFDVQGIVLSSLYPGVLNIFVYIPVHVIKQACMCVPLSAPNAISATAASPAVAGKNGAEHLIERRARLYGVLAYILNVQRIWVLLLLSCCTMASCCCTERKRDYAKNLVQL